jgi:hypothetical protein
MIPMESSNFDIDMDLWGTFFKTPEIFIFCFAKTIDKSRLTMRHLEIA